MWGIKTHVHLVSPSQPYQVIDFIGGQPYASLRGFFNILHPTHKCVLVFYPIGLHTSIVDQKSGVTHKIVVSMLGFNLNP